MNTTPLKNFAVQSRNILKQGVLNRILTLGFDMNGNITVSEPARIQGGSVFMDQLQDENFYDAWMELKGEISAKGVKNVCEEAAYTWFNRLIAIRIMQKNLFIEPVMEYVDEASRMPVIVAQARAGRLTFSLNAADRDKLNKLLADPTRIDDQFKLLIEAFCELNPVIYKCFGGIDKYVSLLLPDNILSKGGFVDLLNNTTYLTDEDYAQTELIGWLYQFYISEKKAEVFASKKKVSKDDIPAATQIFTPNWIVKYMVQNTLGCIYLDNNPESSLGDEMKYLVKSEVPSHKDSILKIDELSDYKLIDPACGSGHILIEGFDLLYAMYMDGLYPEKEAIEKILRNNLIGIDLDTRAKQLATFALLMKAAQKNRSYLDAKVMPRVLDMPRPFSGSEGDLRTALSRFFAGGSETTINETADAVELLRQADNLGSIMKFKISDSTRHLIATRTAEWEGKDFIPEEIKNILPSMRLILALTDKYTVVVANPPYMGSKNMNPDLSKYVAANYAAGKADLATVFVQMFKQRTEVDGAYAFIIPPSWLFLSTFESLRRDIIDNQSIDSMLHLSRGVFGADFGSAATVIRNSKSENAKGIYFRLVERTFQEFDQKHLRMLFELTLANHDFKYKFSDYSKDITELTYSKNGKRTYYDNISQSKYHRIPNYRISYWLSDSIVNSFSTSKLKDIACPKSGLSTGDNDRFMRFWFEVSISKICFTNKCRNDFLSSSKKWFPMTKGGFFRKWYGNNEYVLNFYNDGEELKNWLVNNPKDPKTKSFSRYIRNYDRYCMPGISFADVNSGSTNFRYQPEGFIPNARGPYIYSTDKCLLGYLNSCIPNEILNALTPTMSYNVGDVGLVPYVPINDKHIEQIVDSNISISQTDWDVHETSWDFKENELIRIAKNESAKSLERTLMCYRSEWEGKFEQLHENEEELNRKFIEIYGLQDDFIPDVPLDEVTILKAGEITHVKDTSEYGGGHYTWNYDNLMKQFISYAIGCWMGRYRLDKPGLNIAHYPKEEEICSYPYNDGTFTIDDDGIIPLMTQQNPFEDDNALQKIVKFVRLVFGEDSLTQNLNFIEHCLRKSIENYLVKDFWKDHKKMYQNCPIYWLFSSKKGSFQVLAYMHRMNPYTAEKVRTKYLLPYIEYLQSRIQQDKDRGADLSDVERKSLSEMEAALAECQEYHDRLHSVADRQIGFDLDDGVAVNYAKFGDVLAKIK